MEKKQFANFHVHISPDLETNFKTFDLLRELNTTKINILAINYLRHPIDENLRALYCKYMYTKAKISVFGGLYYSSQMNHFKKPYLQQAEELLAMGCDGIKLIEEKPNYRRYIGFGLNSKIYDEMFDMLEEKQIPIIAHVNDPITNWDKTKVSQDTIDLGWCYSHKSFLSYEEIYAETFERLERNPNLKITFAHFFFMSEDINRVTELFEKYPNMAFDITPGGEMFVGFSKKVNEWHDFFTRYSDRIYFGTDMEDDSIYGPTVQKFVDRAISESSEDIFLPFDSENTIKGLYLDSETQEKIRYGNFSKLIKSPKPVDVKLLDTEICYMKELLMHTDGDVDAIKRLDEMHKKLISNSC